jgi:hypothetical protein
LTRLFLSPKATDYDCAWGGGGTAFTSFASHHICGSTFHITGQTNSFQGIEHHRFSFIKALLLQKLHFLEIKSKKPLFVWI